ncbi:MAG: lysozyme inhibitor LprI family protein [Hyphomicrobiaceae bacterium]
MRRARTAVFCLAVSCVASTLSPVERARAQAEIDCQNAMSTAEINVCADKEFDAADKELNAAYRSALAAIPGMASEKPYDAKSWEAALRASQRAWVAFRDAECVDHLAFFWQGGSGASADIIGCKTELTKARTQELKERYETSR